MIPEHISPKNTKRWSNAPYNFIPLPEKIVPAQELPDQDTYHPSLHTGQIQCDLETRTPLYTRGALRPQFFKQYDQIRLDRLKSNQEMMDYAAFFRYDEAGKPVIGGSSLRGMTRSLAEILAYGKVQWVTGKKLMYRVVGDVSVVGESYRMRFFGPQGINSKGVKIVEYPSSCVRGGYLVKKGSDWFICPAQTDRYGNSFILINYSACQSAGLMPDDNYLPSLQNVFVQPTPRELSGAAQHGSQMLAFHLALTTEIQKAEGSLPTSWMEGKLIFSHPFGSPRDNHPKHRHAVIYQMNGTLTQDQWLPVPDEMIALLREDEGISRRKNPAQGIDHYPRNLATHNWSKDPTPQPVFYLMDEESLVFFGPTMMFRLPYQNAPLAFVPPELRDEFRH